MLRPSIPPMSVGVGEVTRHPGGSHVELDVLTPSPTNTKQLVSFIQKVRYLSRFIDLLSQLIFPLQQLTNQNTFSWDEASEQCFKEVKEVLSSLPTIAPPNWEQVFFVNPSVGEDTLGALLMQKDKKSSLMQPIYLSSRMMKGAEKGFNSNEKVILALMFAMTKF